MTPAAAAGEDVLCRVEIALVEPRHRHRAEFLARAGISAHHAVGAANNELIEFGVVLQRVVVLEFRRRDGTLHAQCHRIDHRNFGGVGDVLIEFVRLGIDRRELGFVAGIAIVFISVSVFASITNTRVPSSSSA